MALFNGKDNAFLIIEPGKKHRNWTKTGSPSMKGAKHPI
jgi:hypothetical protein